MLTDKFKSPWLLTTCHNLSLSQYTRQCLHRWISATTWFPRSRPWLSRKLRSQNPLFL